MEEEVQYITTVPSALRPSGHVSSTLFQVGQYSGTGPGTISLTFYGWSQYNGCYLYKPLTVKNCKVFVNLKVDGKTVRKAIDIPFAWAKDEDISYPQGIKPSADNIVEI